MPSKYQIIIATLTEHIETGQLKKGQKLPSIRTLSQTFQCSKDTVQKALLELKYQHKIYAVEKSGYYVLENFQEQADETILSPQDTQAGPYEDFRICLNESLVGHTDYLFNYYHQQEGLEQLLLSLQQLLTESHVYAKKEQLVITAGSQQALYILSQLIFPNQGKTILVEEPTYHRMRELLEEQDLPFHTVQRNLDGIDLTVLEKLFATGDIACFYMIPRLHNPLGTSYSRKDKAAILKLAQTYNVYLIEDDYMADFDPDKDVPFHYLDTEQCVIYIKSFSTTLFPALRIAGVVLPPQLVERFLAIKSLMDYDTNLIMQKALSLYIDNGLFNRNTLLLREQALEKLATAKQLCSEAAIFYPYHLSPLGLVLQLPATAVRPSLKHSSLPLKWFANNDYQFCLLPIESQFEEHLSQLQTLITQS